MSVFVIALDMQVYLLHLNNFLSPPFRQTAKRKARSLMYFVHDTRNEFAMNDVPSKWWMMIQQQTRSRYLWSKKSAHLAKEHEKNKAACQRRGRAWCHCCMFCATELDIVCHSNVRQAHSKSSRDIFWCFQISSKKLVWFPVKTTFIPALSNGGANSQITRLIHSRIKNCKVETMRSQIVVLLSHDKCELRCVALIFRLDSCNCTQGCLLQINNLPQFGKERHCPNESESTHLSW